MCALYSSEVQWLHVCDVLSYITLSVCSTSWQLEMLMLMMMTMTMMAMILMVLIFLAILMILIILMILMVMVMLADYMVSGRLKPRTSTN